MQLFSVPVITTLLISCSGLPVLAAEARDAESYFNTNAGSSVDMPFYGFFAALTHCDNGQTLIINLQGDTRRKKQ